MNKLIFTFFFSASTLISYGQVKSDNNRDSLNKFCDKVMQTFVDGKFSNAIQLFKQNSVMDSVSINNLDKTVNEQMAGILPFYKELIVGYELIEEKAIKNTLVRRRYLLKFKRYFLTFDFILYNNGQGWTVSNFNYKDEPLTLF